MIGMGFGAFLTLLILGFIAAIIMHSAIRYRMLAADGFVAKWIAGWIGGWLGSPVLGHWWFHIQNVYVIPALIGAFVGAFSFVALVKANANANAAVVMSKTATVSTVPAEIRKAS